jgi:hypothetical protein
VAYNQAIFKWDTTILPSVNVNYDSSRDGVLNGGNYCYSSEEGNIISSVSAISNNYDKIVFVVKATDTGANGYTCGGQKYIFVFEPSPDLRITISHELGHAQCRLVDLGPPYNSSTDTDNLMWGSFLSTKWRLRKNQWDLCNPK